ncbi:MAG TPA: hypothetical protein VMJ10_12330 [Kofleriaceae bacterium]|nr:hypothetical protein [Kofleriaceae bacterium]
MRIWLVPCLLLASCSDHSNVEAHPLQLAPQPVPHAKPGEPQKPNPGTPLVQTSKTPAGDQMYTTYFYTASEAVIHGYEDKTKVRIVSLADPLTKRQAGTIWEGTIGIGESKTVPTGAGVFGLLSDKKAAILVGTPSSCEAVGYFLKDQEGRFRSDHFFTQLPRSTYSPDVRMVVWAPDAADVSIHATKTQKLLAQKSLAAGGRLELRSDALASLGNSTVEISSTKSPVQVEVYYDEGFIVPSVTGSGNGTDFYTFVGALTQGANDLDLMALDDTAHVTVTDVDSGKSIFAGDVKSHGIHTLYLSDRYVRVHSDKPIQLEVAAYDHDGKGYAEHHFATGHDGGGIDNDFTVTTSEQVWLFSYYDKNAITITDARGSKVFTGKLDAGTGHGITPGLGMFHVHSDKGMSVMGGSSSCGADYSPAAGMFAVDEAMLKVIQQVTEARIQEAHDRGVTLTPQAAAAAPLTATEWQKYGEPAKTKAYRSMTVDEANARKAELAK